MAIDLEAGGGSPVALKVARQMFDQIGTSGLANSNSDFLVQDFLPELSGTSGYRTYREMHLNEPVLGAVTQAIELTMRSATVKITPADLSNQGREAADILRTAIGDMEHAWDQVLIDFNSMFPYGASLQEVTFKTSNGDVRDPAQRSAYADGKVRIRSIEGRSLENLTGWMRRDPVDKRRITHVAFNGPPDFREYELPLDKCLHLRPTSYLNDPNGISIYRRAYKSYWTKKRIEMIEAIGLERDLAGFPLLQPPPEVGNIWDADDAEMVSLLASCKRFLMSVRRNQNEGAVIPPGWEFKLLASGGNRQFDTGSIITRYELRMAASALGDVVLLGQQQVGSKSLAESKLELLFMAIRAHMKTFEQEFTRKVAQPLMRANGIPVQLTPRLSHHKLRRDSLGELAAFLNALGNATNAKGSPAMRHPDVVNELFGRVDLPEVGRDVKWDAMSDNEDAAGAQNARNAGSGSDSDADVDPEN